MHGVWQLRRAPTAPCTGSRAFSSALGTRTQHVASRPLVTPFGSHPHTKTPNFVVGTAEGPIASELDSSALTNSMLPRGLRHHSRSGWEDALTAASLVKRASLAISAHLSRASPGRDKASEQRRDVHSQSGAKHQRVLERSAALLVSTSTRELSGGYGDYAQQHHTALTLGSSACFGAASVLTSLQISWLLGAASGSSSTMRDW